MSVAARARFSLRIARTRAPSLANVSNRSVRQVATAARAPARVSAVARSCARVATSTVSRSRTAAWKPTFARAYSWSRALEATPTIQWTRTDEAPLLATYSFLPVVQAYTKTAGVDVQLADISLGARIISTFNDILKPEQRVPDALAQLGELALSPEANIIKLPNISASVPQLKAAIAELQAKGYQIPNYPEDPKTEDERAVVERYKKVMGSAVNPVLREGNSDRRAPPAVKAFARANPHRMGKWSKDSPSHVASMQGKGDFFSNEKSHTCAKAMEVEIEFVPANGGQAKIMKKSFPLLKGEIIDGTFMSKSALVDFLTSEVADAKAKGVLFSLHMKATMMKVSDPIIFGHAVRVYFKAVFDKFGPTLDRLGVNVNNGLGDLLSKIRTLPEGERKEIEAAVEECYRNGPDLAMVNSDKGITNLHVPSDVIIDASMPVLVRDGGQMWNKDGKAQAAKAVIPDSCYAPVYAEMIEFCKENGAFDPKTMGSSPNVGLMAQKAEEYGSHDKTFEAPANGTMRIVDAATREVLISHEVEQGDIWRACQTKDEPVRDWVKLAVTRARASGSTACFWLDENRAHDAQILKKVHEYLKDHDTSGLDIKVLPPGKASRFTCEKLVKGEDCISVTGNVLRDYNTDLFPILEVGTSAKMLSIVPLMNGGGLFETGAGGSAPKHIQQLQEEGYLRWDSLGEFLALAVSLTHLADTFNNKTARILGAALDNATTQYLLNNKSPGRKLGTIDNRGGHYYVALYWAQELAKQTEDTGLAAKFSGVAKELQEAENKVTEELKAAQGKPADTGGYYWIDEPKTVKAMRPSSAFNHIIDNFHSKA